MREIRDFALEVASTAKKAKSTRPPSRSRPANLRNHLRLRSLQAKAALRHGSENYTRLINALFRLSDGGIKLERYRAEIAERKAAIAKRTRRAGPGGLSPGTIEKSNATQPILTPM